MADGVLFFLVTSLVLYLLFGGADFGAGILEFFTPLNKKHAQRELTQKAIGAVWEANHIWLIVAIVILFTGYPTFYHDLLVHYHIPVTIMLVGITLRGCAFTFRHYDPSHEKHDDMYSRFFELSSILAPFAQGLVIGGMFAPFPKEPDFLAMYVHPWWNVWCCLLGVFVCALYAFTAAVFFVGEADEPELHEWCRKRVKWAWGAVILSGCTLLPASLSTVLVVVVSYPLLHKALLMKNPLPGRMVASGIVMWTGAAWWTADFLTSDLHLSLIPAPDKVMSVLFWSVSVACLMVFPSLFMLYRTFKKLGS